MRAYLDSSVLLRPLLGQAKPLAERSRIESGVTSAITSVECLRAADRLRLVGALDDEQVADLRTQVSAEIASLEILGLTRGLLQLAAGPFPTVVRALDAIHVATAVLWRAQTGPDFVFATHDTQQATAARALGFDVVGC